MKTVGGTLASRILGLSKWGGPLSAYFELVADVQAEHQEAMGRGTALEQSVLWLWVERHGHDPQGLLRPAVARIPGEPGLPHAHSTVDAWYTNTILEAKTLAIEQMGPDWGPDGSDRLDPGYHAQVMWYHGVCRAAGLAVEDEAFLPVLVGPEAELQWAAKMAGCLGRPLALADIAGTRLELRTYVVTWDTELFEEMNRRVLRFLREHVEPRLPPTPGPGDLLTERDQRAIARGIHAQPGQVLDFERLAGTEQALVLELLEANRQRKAWEKQEAQAEARVKLAMATAEEVRGLPGGARVAWKESAGGTRRFQVHEPRRK